MVFFIILGVVAFLLLAAMGAFNQEEDGSTSYNSNSNTSYSKTTDPMWLSLLEEGQDYYVGEKCIGLSARKGYSKIPMVGMMHRNLDRSDLGKFEGWAEAETDNEHDPYAIAIYREDYIHVGYLPRGNSELHELIESEGGRVHCYGFIACERLDDYGEPEYYYAAVCVETDKDLVVERNKPYDTTDKFYEYNEGDLQETLEIYQV